MEARSSPAGGGSAAIVDKSGTQAKNYDFLNAETDEEFRK